VQLTDGSWRAARINEIGASLAATSNAAETPLGDLAGLKVIAAVERTTLDTKAAQELAKKSVGGLLLVTDNSAPVGILVEGVRRGIGSNTGLALSSTSLDQLGGKYVKLKDYGSILLSSSKK
jgi:hypothetical protein